MDAVGAGGGGSAGEGGCGGRGGDGTGEKGKGREAEQGEEGGLRHRTRRTLGDSATLIVDGFVHIMHRAPPTFCREAFSRGGRIPGRCLSGWGSADRHRASPVSEHSLVGSGDFSLDDGCQLGGSQSIGDEGDYFGDEYGMCESNELGLHQSVKASWASHNTGELARNLMQSGCDESTARVNIVRQEYVMSISFTSDAELAGTANVNTPITSSPAVWASVLPMPRRMRGTSLASFKFGRVEAAAVMSVLERCPPDQVAGLRCHVSFTHKSGRAHVSVLGLFVDTSKKPGPARLGSQAGYSGLVFENVRADEPSAPSYRVLERGGDRFGGGGGVSSTGACGEDDYVTQPLCVELDCVIVGVGHSLLITLPLPPLMDISRALESESIRRR